MTSSTNMPYAPNAPTVAASVPAGEPAPLVSALPRRARVRRQPGLQRYFAGLRLGPPRMVGVVTRILGVMVEATAPEARVGDFFRIGSGARAIRAEVVAIKNRTVVLLPYGSVTGLGAGDTLTRIGTGDTCPVGATQLGRVLDSLGEPLDGGAPPASTVQTPLHRAPLSLTERRAVRERLVTGVRTLDTMIPLGMGQRLGIFAGPGVGKSTLLGMLTKGCTADVIVLALVGERGREVGHFVDDVIGVKGRARSIVVAATSDRPASERVRAAFSATAMAEHFRDQGKHVLLFVDSLTRLCMAQRDIGLATGEPPTSKGYPPSAFSMLPRLLERVAPARGRGSITGVYTVLVEGDNMNEPVADAARGLLDGHVVLTRKLAARGHFPAIDVLDSLSRLESELLAPETLQAARRVRGLLGKLEESRELVAVGAYRPGADTHLDVALSLERDMLRFLQQRQDERVSAEDSAQALLWLSRESIDREIAVQGSVS